MGEWLYEGKPPAKKQNAKFSSLKLSAKKLGIFCDATNELLDDASSFGSALERAMILSVAWYNDWTYLNGDGVGKPLGVLNCPSLVKVQKDAGQSTPITYSNLARMFARMHPACMQNAVWVVNTSAIPQLLMTFPNDGAGNGGTQPILKEDGKGGYTMFTRPVLFTEKLPAVGSMGDVLFADFSQYVIGLRKEGTIERSSAVGWETDTTAYRLITRGDGFGKWPKAVTPKNGDSLSWAIALEARS
jgi:HK97 family phage major capsid protein